MAQTAISRIVVENRWSKFCFISHNIWFVVFDLHNTTSPNSVPKWLINAISQDTKKAWRPTVARSTYWGPRIAQLIRTSNHDPTPICKITPAKLSRCTSLHTHGRLSLLLFLNEFESFLRFQVVKNKRVIYAFSINGVPHRQRNSFLMAFPVVVTPLSAWGQHKVNNYS